MLCITSHHSKRKIREGDAPAVDAIERKNHEKVGKARFVAIYSHEKVRGSCWQELDDCGMFDVV